MNILDLENEFKNKKDKSDKIDSETENEKVIK